MNTAEKFRGLIYVWASQEVLNFIRDQSLLLEWSLPVSDLCQVLSESTERSSTDNSYIKFVNFCWNCRIFISTIVWYPSL